MREIYRLGRQAGAAAATVAVLLLGVTPLAAAEVKERVLGDPEAPVTIIEYASYTCPHCAAFHTETLPELKERYIDTGKAKLIMREFPLDEAALNASLLAQCAGDSYFQFADAFFSTQEQWARAAQPAAALGNMARLGGLTPEQIEACTQDEGMVEAVLQMRLEGQQQHDISSTPSFVIDGEVIRGNQGAEAMGEAIEDALAAQG